MSRHVDDARRLIQSRLADIDAEAERLRRALGGLGEGAAPSPRRASRPATRVGAKRSDKPRPRAGRRPEASKRAARGQRREELLAAIKATPGARPAELAAAIGIRPTQVSVLIAKARAEGLIVKRGDGYALKA